MNKTYWFWGLLAVPGLLVVSLYGTDAITYGQAVHQTGQWSVALLVLVLSITPLQRVFTNASWLTWLRMHRRPLGVASFVYAGLHTAIYLERKWGAGLILKEGLEAPLATGWLAAFLMLLLALTSNGASVRMMGARWKSLHRAVYPAAALTLLHWLLASFNPVPAYFVAGLLLLIEGLRYASPKSS